jgi:hypothetical protein
MGQLRTMRGFVRTLVMLFVIAQFAGVVSSPMAHAHPASATATAHADHRRVHSHDHQGRAHEDHGQCGDQADYCCALHAFFAGVIPPAIAIDAVNFVDLRLTPQPNTMVAGLGPGRLDRPPRPLL